MTSHTFHLLSTAHYSQSDYARWPPDDEGVQISDDVVGYMWDALLWVPCRYPHAEMRQASGPDRYGPSVVAAEGAEQLARILDGFAEIFSSGPERFRLNCGPLWIETGNSSDATANSMQWRFVEFPREEIVGRLRRVADAARAANNAPDVWFIAIRGI
jgi:hypothetical protein